MYELLYTSVALSSLSETELISILEVSRSRNLNIDVTGMLVYHDREFMQILEGDESVVKDLYQAISKDHRHTSVEVFYQGPVQYRSFSEWSMAFKQLDQDDAENLISGFEKLERGKSPISMVNDSHNRGKKIFLQLRDTL